MTWLKNDISFTGLDLTIVYPRNWNNAKNVCVPERIGLENTDEAADIRSSSHRMKETSHIPTLYYLNKRQIETGPPAKKEAQYISCLKVVKDNQRDKSVNI